MEPEVLVLDEPTAGLDPQGVQDLVGFINSLSTKYGMTVIFSTHDVGLVAEVSDYIYVMNKGRFVAEGNVEEIFMQPDMLKSMRLDVPVLPKLLRSLQKNDIPVSMAYTYEDTEKSLLAAYKGKP
jgi:cobalt/nickel transport system ATP-binding protein